jgi:3D (Asp-Asp-Asp) domain-containing protein
MVSHGNAAIEYVRILLGTGGTAALGIDVHIDTNESHAFDDDPSILSQYLNQHLIIQPRRASATVEDVGGSRYSMHKWKSSTEA